MEVLSARPYAYLDDAPLEERRTQAVMARRWMAPESAADLGRLDPEAIARVRTEAWPDPVNAEELHDCAALARLPERGRSIAAPEWRGWLAALAQDNRVTRLRMPQATLWVAAERASAISRHCPTDTDALADILRGRLEGLGPVTQAALAAPLGLEADDISAALVALEVEGFALRGHFTPGSNAGGMVRPAAARADSSLHRPPTACRDRAGRRARLPSLPVRLAAGDAMRRDWKARMRFLPPSRCLKGFEAPAGAWETEILPARIIGYEPTWLDDMCLAGRIAWGRLTPGARASAACAHNADHAAGTPTRCVLDFAGEFNG